MKAKTLSIVIPSYNESKTLEELVGKVLAVKLPFGFSKEIIIVNDASKDNSLEIMRKLAAKNKEIIVLDNPKNLGKTQTVRKGFMKTSGEVVVVQDADLEYEPEELKELLELMINENLDVVYGNRFGKKNKVIYWKNYYGNKGISFISNIFTYPRIRKFIPDMEVCYKMVKGEIIRDIAPKITAKSNFGLEPELTARLARYKKDGKRLKFGIVPISYFARSIEEGKKMKAFKDGFKALKEIIRYNLGRQ